MPFGRGNLGAHDDSSHQGSAKRDTANGVAGLSSAGNVLAQGEKVVLKRDASNDIFVNERTSSENAFRLRRIGASDYQAHVVESGVVKQVQTESMKNIASGIVGLDAQKLIGGGILSAFNLLKIYDTNIFTQTLIGTGTITSDPAAGTIAFSGPALGDDALALETDKIALSLLPRICVFKVTAINVTPSATVRFGFGLASTTYASGNQQNACITSTGAQWIFQTSTGAGSTVTNIAAPAAGDVFVFYATSARVVVWKNGALLAAHNATIPTAALGRGGEIIQGGSDSGASATLGFLS